MSATNTQHHLCRFTKETALHTEQACAQCHRYTLAPCHEAHARLSEQAEAAIKLADNATPYTAGRVLEIRLPDLNAAQLQELVDFIAAKTGAVPRLRETR